MVRGKTRAGMWFTHLPSRQWDHNCNCYLVESGRNINIPSDGERQRECEAGSFLKWNKCSWVSHVLYVPSYFSRSTFFSLPTVAGQATAVQTTVYLTCLLENNQSSTRWKILLSLHYTPEMSDLPGVSRFSQLLSHPWTFYPTETVRTACQRSGFSSRTHPLVLQIATKPNHSSLAPFLNIFSKCFHTYVPFLPFLHRLALKQISQFKSTFFSLFIFCPVSNLETLSC